MSSHSPTNDPASFGGTILLIEEYDALAAALTSALRQFAPRHGVFNVRTFSDATSSLQNVCPELVIIDFDPPADGVTEFMVQARKLCPHGRAIVMGGGISPELASEYRRFGAVHFLPKPFEITDFGATVQALLGPTVQTRAALGSLGAADLTLLHCAGARTASLQVKGNGSKTGEIHIIEGEIVHARTAKRKDRAALEEMFGWSEPRIEERAAGAVRRSIRQDWAEIFLEAVVEAKPRPTRRVARTVRAPDPQLQAPLAPAPPPAAPPLPKTGKKVVIVDDTEMLLVFVEDTLTLAAPDLRITTASNGITGIKEIQTLLPDLVLLDYSLPDINGDEVCRRLLASERTRGIPVIMMSGHIPEMTAAAETFPNIVATIAKPFMSEALSGLVQQTLELGPRARPKAQAKPVAMPAKPAPPGQSKEPVKEKPAVPSKPPRQTPLPGQPPQAKAPSASAIENRKAPAAPSVPPPLPVRPSQVRATAAPPPQRVTPPLPQPVRPAEPSHERPMEPHVRLKQAITAPVVTSVGNEVVMGLFLNVVSMQLTPSLRMGAIRARPSSFTVSLHVSPAALRGLPVEIGFELGRVEIDSNQQIRTIRVIPTLQAFQRMPTRSAVQIGALNFVPQDSREHVQLTPSPNAPMTMHLLAHLELAGVELSTSFQLAQLVLKNRSTTVRVTLSSDAVAQEQTGVFCETSAVRLDQSGKIAEMLLKPLK